jgi:diguanylate cyclase (GGDEF)-like protein
VQQSDAFSLPAVPRSHPRTLGWPGTVALAMGGSNQSLFLIGAVVATQGTAAVPLLVAGLVLSWMALPGWIELVLMWPERVGGISATCAEAFRPYSPVLANLTGVSYWWGWIPTCGLTALLSSAALHDWYLPGVPVKLLATAIVLTFMTVNLVGVRWASRVAIPIACASVTLALLSVLVPVLTGHVDWARATSFHLDLPFHGVFGTVTSAMAGLYLIGFAAPAFEAAACHVGETRDPFRTVPKAMYLAATVATLYFVAIPVVWLGVIGRGGLEGELMHTLGPTFAPLLAGGAKAAAVWFMVLNMFHGSLQPLAGAARTMSQLSEDGLLPRAFARRNRHDAPWVATVVTALLAITFLMSGDPPWVIAAANFCYLIGIGMPSVAVWLLRRNAPHMPRPYRAPRWTVGMGALAAIVWLTATLLGLQQFGLPTVIASLGMAYSGSVLYAWRRYHDHRASPGGEERSFFNSLHSKLTGAMVGVMILDGVGYLLAVHHVDATSDPALVAVLEDIFVAVAILTVSVGLVLPGMIAHAVSQVADAAGHLARGPVADLTRAMGALSRGDMEAAKASTEIITIDVRSGDEVGHMADSFNDMQREVASAAVALGDAREGLRASRRAAERGTERQAMISALGQQALEGMPVDELMALAAEAASSALDAHSGLVSQLEPHGDAVRVRAVSAALTELLHTRLPPDPEATVPMTHNGPVSCSDWDPAARGDLPGALAGHGLRAWAGVPIAGPGGAYGWICVFWAEPHTATTDELDFLRTVSHLLANAIDRDRAAQEIRHQALHDPLTGLPNRVLFVDRLSLALAQCARRGNAVAVLFLDLDHFKFINDSLGHSAGDDLLQALATRLASTLRPGDTVARFGGDEFVIICDDLLDVGQAEHIALRTIDALGRPFVVNGTDHVVTASIGIALAIGEHRLAEDMVREADAAMYRAKERGRGRYELFDEVMRAKALFRLRTENELRSALGADELRVHYQPLIDLEEGHIHGVEALVRWEHPTRGLLGPAEFIPVAEDGGLIGPLGAWVLHEVCTQAATWQAARPGARPLAIAVNLSARQLMDPSTVDTVALAIARSGIDPSSLFLEITESVLMDDPEASAQTLERLKGLGVSISLDDFGTGYSSLAYLRRYPIDVIKVDREFVPRIAETGPDAAIFQAVLSMGQSLGIAVVAEGVETPEQELALRALGCRLAQGFLYAHPMPAAAIDRILAGADDSVLRP